MQHHPSIVTPIGVAVYPHRIEPDTKFSASGDYKVSLALEGPESEDLITTISEALEEAKSMAPGWKQEAPMPFIAETTDDGDLTGRVLFKFKMKALINRADGTTVSLKPKLFDSAGTLCKPSSLWGGSRLRVSADVVPYHVAAIGAGVSLRLKAAQIIELQDGGRGAESFGFQATEGYVGSASEEDDLSVEEEEEAVAGDF